jgi:quercetin dioxygenase-like cupin family protein
MEIQFSSSTRTIVRCAAAALAAVLLSTKANCADQPPAVLAPDDTAVAWQKCQGWPVGCEFAVIWADGTTGASGAYVRAPRGYLFQRASHTATERIIVLRGRVSSGVDGVGESMLSPGMSWGIPAKSVHWAKCEDPCLMYIHFDGPYDHVLH